MADGVEGIAVFGCSAQPPKAITPTVWLSSADTAPTNQMVQLQLFVPLYWVKSGFALEMTHADSLSIHCFPHCGQQVPDFYIPVSSNFIMVYSTWENHFPCSVSLTWHSCELMKVSLQSCLIGCCLCFPSERTCPLLRVVFQRHAASPWAASAPPWAPCRLPTCMSTPWSHSTTRFPHQRSLRGLRATPLCHRPVLPRWPAPTSAAWAPSPSWSQPRTGTAQLSSLPSSWEGTMHRGEGTEEGSRTQASEDGARAGMGWLTWL